jgi:hypothetical protein
MMITLGIALDVVNLLAFLLVGLVILARLREVKGSLRLAKISFAMAAFSAAAGFLVTIVQQLIYDPSGSQNLLIAQLFVPANMFAMLVLAFLASFAIFATYSGGKRKLIVLLLFVVALIPTAYLALTYDQLAVNPPTPDMPESYQLELTLAVMILFALCGAPLGVIPLAAFGRSFIAARKRGDRVLSRRAAMMFSAIVLNMIAYIMYVFPLGVLRFVALAAWVPIQLLLLYAVLRITSSVRI